MGREAHGFAPRCKGESEASYPSYVALFFSKFSESLRMKSEEKFEKKIAALACAHGSMR